MHKALVKHADILTVQLDIKILPYIVQDIAHLIGLPNAIKLVEHFGGTSMWVPDVFNPEHKLVLLLGAEATIKLIEQYGANSHEIPKCQEAMRVVRNALIRASDQSQSVIARRWGLTVRQIRNIQHGAAVQDKQESLF